MHTASPLDPSKGRLSIARTPADLEEAMALRYEVFCDEQQIPREIERDAEDDVATHVLLRDSAGCVAATGRVLRQRREERLVALGQPGEPGDVARIGRMAVRARDRKAGLGRLVLEALEGQAAQAGLREAVLHAQLHAEPFYRSCGYARRGPVFDEAGIPHVEMAKPLL